MRKIKTYNLGGIAGLVAQRVAKSTGAKVSLFRGDQSGLNADQDVPWITVCEKHSSCVSHKVLKDARSWMAEPETWCEGCRGKNDVSP
jgi:hypothetical protein